MPWHTGKTCDDVERERGEEVADKSFAEFRQTTRVVDCPTCGIGITKIDGCNRVMCAPHQNYRSIIAASMFVLL
jgi:hypothetical protein